MKRRKLSREELSLVLSEASIYGSSRYVAEWCGVGHMDIHPSPGGLDACPWCSEDPVAVLRGLEERGLA